MTTHSLIIVFITFDTLMIWVLKCLCKHLGQSHLEDHDPVEERGVMTSWSFRCRRFLSRRSTIWSWLVDMWIWLVHLRLAKTFSAYYGAELDVKRPYDVHNEHGEQWQAPSVKMEEFQARTSWRAIRVEET